MVLFAGKTERFEGTTLAKKRYINILPFLFSFFICALLGGFAIGARVALLWQHNANAKFNE